MLYWNVANMGPINEDERKKRTVHSSISNELFFSLSLSVCTNLLNSFIKAIDLIWTFTHHRQQQQQQFHWLFRAKWRLNWQISSPDDRVLHSLRLCVHSIISTLSMVVAVTFNFLGGSKKYNLTSFQIAATSGAFNVNDISKIIAINFNLLPLNSHWLSICTCYAHCSQSYVYKCWFLLYCKCKMRYVRVVHSLAFF